MDEQTGAGGEYGRTEVQVQMDGKGQKMEMKEVWAAKAQSLGRGAGGGTITEEKHEKTCFKIQISETSFPRYKTSGNCRVLFHP